MPGSAEDTAKTCSEQDVDVIPEGPVGDMIKALREVS